MISFIVIGKNEGWRLGKCLNAVKRIASWELSVPFEIIYVDSKSTDGSVELSREYADKIYQIEGECCAAIGRNVGAKEAKGEILFFLDGDMELREGVLPTIFDEKGHLIHRLLSGVEYEHLYDNEWNKIEERPRESPTGMMAVEKQIWDEVGGMDNRFVRSEDVDLIWRADSKGVEYHRMSQLWVNHYTRYYAVRSEPYSVYKYHALLTRRHLFDKQAFWHLTLMNYSCYCLIISLITFVVSFNFLVFVPYCLILIYRAVRIIKHTHVKLNFINQLWRRFVKDLTLVWYFLTFYPKQPIISYRYVK